MYIWCSLVKGSGKNDSLHKGKRTQHMHGPVIFPVELLWQQLQGEILSIRPYINPMKQSFPVYNCEMAYLISSPLASSKPVRLFHAVTYYLSQKPKCTLGDICEPVINSDLSTFPLNQIWDILPANPVLKSTSQPTQGYISATSPCAGLAPQFTRLYISNLLYFLSPNRNYSRQDAEILLLCPVNDFLQVQKAPNYPTQFSPEHLQFAS